ncbi:MAG: adenylosuccinate lyase [Chitinophagales bacterium]
MNLSALSAISPIDGRYRNKVENLDQYFSEYALIKYRVRVEIEYFIALCEFGVGNLKDFPKEKYNTLRNLYKYFNLEDAEAVKVHEQKINHDVKAVEYFIKDYFISTGLKAYAEFIHFGLTSQDINNTAVPLSLKEGLENEIYPEVENIIAVLEGFANEWSAIPMLAKTHGQPASPTLLGKEIMVFVERLKKQFESLKKIPVAAKFGGATGNFNAHYVAFPDKDWKAFANDFVADSLGLERSQYTTQIEHYDFLAALFDNLKRIDTILIDLCRDVWQYISMDYFKQSINKDEVGSSAMPHKVNPIDFENAEGNLGMASAIFEHLSAKLPISRLQRDLTDSTVLRNIGIPVAHLLIALKSLDKGLKKLKVNEAALNKDLENNWAVVAEAVQTVLRREGIPKPYELLKDLTRKSDKMDQESIHEFINGLDLDASVKDELLQITPFNYTGMPWQKN